MKVFKPIPFSKFFLFLLLSISLMTSQVFAQSRILDSLNARLKLEKVDTSRAIINYQMAKAALKEDTVSAFGYFDEAIKLATKSNEKIFLLNLLERIGNVCYRNGKEHRAKFYLLSGVKKSKEFGNERKVFAFYAKLGAMMQYMGLSRQSIPFYDSAISLASKIDPALHADLLVNLGRAYYDMADYTTAMKYYLNANDIYEKNKLFNHNYGGLLHYIGSVFKRQNNNKKALEYYEKELELSYKIKDRDLEAEALYLSASMYFALGDPAKELDYLQKALAIYHEQQNYRSEALMLNNLSSHYASVGDYETAVEFAKKAIRIYEEYNIIENRASVYCSIGDYYSTLGKHALALENIKKALEIVKTVETKQLIETADIVHSLAFAYSRMGDYKNAFEQYTAYQYLVDSINTMSNEELVHELEKKYETGKKEQEIVLLNKDKAVQEAEIKQKDTQRNALIFGLILILMLGALAVIAFLNKKKSNKILASQNEEINLKNSMIQEKNKDITDSITYAKRIQEAFLPTQAQLAEYFSSSFVFFRPKDIVSGDFYWFGHFGSKAILAVGDCTGHGVPGAFMSIIGHDILSKIILDEKIHEPSEILKVLDKRISESLNKKGGKEEYQDGMDIALCLFDKSSNMIKFAGANRPFLVKKGDNLVEFPPNKFAIGGSVDSGEKNFLQYEVQHDEGDMFYLFSDGFADQFGGLSGKKLKYSELKNHIKQLENSKTDKHEFFFGELFDSWKGDLEQVDDVCIVGVKL